MHMDLYLMLVILWLAYVSTVQYCADEWDSYYVANM